MNFEFDDVIKGVKDSLKKDKRSDSLDKVSSADNMTEVSRDPKDYVVMPEWWEETYGVLGLPFGKIIQIAGDSDTGKTSLCIEVMKAAQSQGYGIVYVETELKTSKSDLEAWGVNPKGILLVQTNITEEAYDLSFRMINAFFEKYPKNKLLYVFDSIGNNVSMRDDNIDLVNEKQKPGGKSATNRLGLGRLIAMMNKNPIAVLLVNYDYDNIGSHGKTQAGGKALKFYTMVGIQSQRTADWTKTKDKQIVKVGAYVKWTTFKNHFQKAAVDKEGTPRLLPKAISLQISAAGIERSAKGDDE